MSSSSSSSRHHHHHYHNSNRQEYDERELSSSDVNGSNENLVHIKFLLPGTTTGSVIGKGGERIASLQKETNTKMKMSKAGVRLKINLLIKNNYFQLGLFSWNTRTCLSCYWNN